MQSSGLIKPCVLKCNHISEHMAFSATPIYSTKKTYLLNFHQITKIDNVIVSREKILCLYTLLGKYIKNNINETNK